MPSGIFDNEPFTRYFSTASGSSVESYKQGYPQPLPDTSSAHWTTYPPVYVGDVYTTSNTPFGYPVTFPGSSGIFSGRRILPFIEELTFSSGL